MKRLILAGVGLPAVALLGAVPAYADPPATTTPTTSQSVSVSPSPSPSPSAVSAAKSCSAYRWYGTKRTLCDRFANTDLDKDCRDIGFRVQLVSLLHDPWRLDTSRGRGDGVACQALAVRLFPRGTTSATGPERLSASGHRLGGATAGPSLPVTGPSPLWILILPATAAGVLGVALTVAARRRRTRFDA